MSLRSLLLLSVVLLAGCSSLKDTAEPPAELKSFDAEVRFKKVWQRNAGAGSGRFLVNLQPLIDATNVYVADYRGKVTAYDKQNGKKRWRSKLDISVSAAFGHGSEALYLGTRKGEVVAIAKADGSELWRASLTGEVLAPPVADLGMVVVQTADGALHGLSATTGEISWTNRRTVPALSLRGTGSPVAYRGLALTGMDNGRMLALSMLDGRVLWEAPLGSARGRTEIQRMVDADMQPVIEQGMVFASAYQGRVAAVTIDSGRVLWARDISSHSGMSLDYTGSLFLTDENSRLWGLDKRNGATLWMQDKLRARALTKPVALGDYLISGDFEGYIHVLNTADGRIIGRKRYDDEGYLAAPVIDGDIIYMLDKSGELTAFRLESKNKS